MGAMPISPWRLGAARNVAIGAASASSSAVANGCHAVLVTCNGNCHIAIGPSGTAASSSTTYLPANSSPIVLAAAPGEVVSVIQDGASTGNVSVTDLSH